MIMTEAETNYYKTLYEVVKVVNSTLDDMDVLQKITEQVTKSLGVKGCTLRLLDKQGKRLLASASYGLSREYLRKGSVEVEKSGIDKEVLTGKTIAIEDAANDPRFQYPDAAKAENIVSVLAAPLCAEGKYIGVVRVYADRKRDFTKDEIEFLEIIADVSAIAIENARLHQALKSEYELLTEFEYRIFED